MSYKPNSRDISSLQFLHPLHPPCACFSAPMALSSHRRGILIGSRLSRGLAVARPHLLTGLFLGFQVIGLQACLPTSVPEREPEASETVASAPVPPALPSVGDDGDSVTSEFAAHSQNGPTRTSAGVSKAHTDAATAYLTAALPASNLLPRFDLIRDTGERKLDFYRFMYRIIKAENEHIRSDRLRLYYLHDRFQIGGELSVSHRDWLRNLARRYRVDGDKPTADILDRLRRRVDTIPVELAIAQAAIESAWGCSRFARQGNNIYGQWCFDKGCGMVPGDRGVKATHEVAAFDSPHSSVRAYLLNLNTHRSYRLFRELRSQRAQNEISDGHALAAGLRHYSELGDEYIRRLRVIMRQNRGLLQLSRTANSAGGGLRHRLKWRSRPAAGRLGRSCASFGNLRPHPHVAEPVPGAAVH